MELVIKPKNRWWELNLREIWHFRDLFYFFTWRDVKVKYKQTMIGAAWAVFQPFVTMIVFTVFFGRLAKMPSEGIPYPIFVYSGLLFWTLFSSSLSSISNSFVGNERIITKIYFPRVMLPVSAIMTNMIDFLIATIILIGMMMFYGFPPSVKGIIIIPLLLLMTVLTSLGIGLLMSSLNVKYRDVQFALPFFIQLLIFVSPVIYPVTIVSENYRWLLGLNPMAGVIDAARAGILGHREIDWLLMGVSFAVMLVYLAIGYIYFKTVERYFADVI